MPDNKDYQNRIPDKFYFKIGEVSEIAGLPTYVLRFWEDEFPRVNPKRTASGQRLYTKKDVELILEIKELLYEKKFTIKGARQYLNTKSAKRKTNTDRVLEDLRAELESIRELLK
ncbi:MAG: MerR family transcriptional regulator [Desulfobacterales bacterium]|nr:MAG: MerR family transcriptional regulator [Desulfobacterales bacterium]